jgi:hypothetical protein
MASVRFWHIPAPLRTFHRIHFRSGFISADFSVASDLLMKLPLNVNTYYSRWRLKAPAIKHSFTLLWIFSANRKPPSGPHSCHHTELSLCRALHISAEQIGSQNSVLRCVILMEQPCQMRRCIIAAQYMKLARRKQGDEEFYLLEYRYCITFPWNSIDVSEGHMTSIFCVEEQVGQETSKTSNPTYVVFWQ